ncbi:hypothetical protein NC994_02170 [Trichocoleus sp. AS-A1]
MARVELARVEIGCDRPRDFSKTQYFVAIGSINKAKSNRSPLYTSLLVD